MYKKQVSTLSNHCYKLTELLTYSIDLISRHTVVCRVAQEAGTQPREYIDRKKENVIFAPP